MILHKLISSNPLFSTVIGGTIHEYDIRAAGPTAIRELKGNRLYDKIMEMPKKDRSIYIGKMMLKEKGLSRQVNELMLKYLNLFIDKNKITEKHFVYSTRDSIILYGKIPRYTTFGDVEFRNKDGTFSSLYTIKRIKIFFDSMRSQIIVKGIDDNVVNNSYLFQNYLTKYLRLIESCQKTGDMKLYQNLKLMRLEYLNSNSPKLYADVFNNNLIGIRINNELVYIDHDDNISEDNFSIAKEINYINIVMPLMRSAQING